MLFTLNSTDQYFTQGPVPPFPFPSLSPPLTSQHRTGSKLNISAEKKHTSGNDLAAAAARVMNSANSAYRRLLLLVLIAAVTTRLERRWALLPGAHHRQVILICGLFLCHSRARRRLRNVWRLIGAKRIRTWQAITERRAVCSLTLRQSSKN